MPTTTSHVLAKAVGVLSFDVWQYASGSLLPKQLNHFAMEEGRAAAVINANGTK